MRSDGADENAIELAVRSSSGRTFMELSVPATKDSTQLHASLSTFDLPEGGTLPCAGLEPGLVNALQKKREEFCMRKSTSMAVVILLVLGRI